MIEEKTELTKRVEQSIGYCFGYFNSVGSLMDKWEGNKEFFYKKFNNQFIVRTEEFLIDVEDSEQITEGFIEFMDKAKEIISNPFGLLAFQDFYAYAVRTSGFKRNSITFDWDSADIEPSDISQPNGKPIIKVNHGAKFSKSLKNFFFLSEDSNKEKEQEELTQLQNLYSTYRQNFSSKKAGRLYLSMHPLDYLSISDNCHNWSSCHNLFDGEYRVGNLNYMADKATLVAYYASDEDLEENISIFPTGTWNSKRWRALVHVEESDGNLNIIYNKQYPYHSKDLIERLDKLVESVFASNEPSEFLSLDDDRIKGFCHSLYTEGVGSHAYIDIGRESSCYARISTEWLNNPESIERITIGESVHCLDCGHNYIDDEHTGLCYNCNDESYCYDCDGDFHTDDLCYVEAEDIYVCYECFDAFHAECNKCHNACGYNHMSYVEFLDEYVCADCFDEIYNTETSLIFSIGTIGIQVLREGHKLERIKELYDEVKEEQEELVKKLRKETPQVWLISLIKDMPYTEKSVISQDRLREINSIEFQMMRAPYVSRGYYMNEYGHSPFARLEYLGNELPHAISNIILMGSCSQTDLDTYLTELNISLEALDITEQVNLDYSRVRII